MQKIILLTALLLSLNGIAQETTDMHLLELQGPVRYVRYDETWDVTPDGQPTSKSVQVEGNMYRLDRHGRIESATRHGKIIQIIRNAHGDIQRIKMPKTPDSKEDDSYAYTIQWNKDGYPRQLIYDEKDFTTCRTSYIYGEYVNRWVAIDHCDVEESEGWEVMTGYRVLERDEYGNWTKRLEMTVVAELDDEQRLVFNLETRGILYYE